MEYVVFLSKADRQSRNACTVHSLPIGNCAFIIANQIRRNVFSSAKKSIINVGLVLCFKS